MAHRILGDLHQDGVAGLQRELDAPGLVAAGAGVLGGGIPVDLARVQDGVATPTDVDEGGLHAGEHVLDLAEVDVADQRRLLRAGDVVLDEHAVLQDADLDAVGLRADHHHPIDGLAAGEELGLGDHRTAAARVAAVAATLLLGLEAGGALDLLRLGDELGLALGTLTRLARLALAPGLAGATILAGAAVVAGATTRPAAHTGLALVVGLGALREFGQVRQIGRLEDEGRRADRTRRDRGRRRGRRVRARDERVETRLVLVLVEDHIGIHERGCRVGSLSRVTPCLVDGRSSVGDRSVDRS